MKTKLISLLLSTAFIAMNYANAIEMSHQLDCEFLFQGERIMTVKTSSLSSQVVGEFSETNFTGVEGRAKNRNEKLAEGDLFHFTLDEGQPENIFVKVSNALYEKSKNKFHAYAINPVMPILDRLNGHCSLTEKN